MTAATRRTLLTKVALALLPFVAVGCRGVPAKDAADARPSGAAPIEMFSWIERIGDSDPLGALAAVHRRRYPQDEIINARAALSGLARKTLRGRMLRNEPPDTFQANVGFDLMQWVLTNGSDARESKLVPLDGIGVDTTWRGAMPAPLVDRLSYDGRPYAIPANMQRNNMIFYNKQLLAKHGLVEPKSIDDLVAMGNKLREAGVPLLGVGSREAWTVSLLVFECLFVAREGSDVYRDYFKGNLTADDPRIVRTLEAALRLFAYANPDHRNLSWQQAVELVVDGKAAMTVMGDWARGPFAARGMKVGVDYGQAPFPGTANAFVFSSDAFALPIGAKNPAGVLRLLATLASVEGQRAISEARASLSARVDVPPPASDEVLGANYLLLKEGKVVNALSGLVPPAFGDDVSASLLEMLDLNDVDPVVHTLRSRYALLH